VKVSVIVVVHAGAHHLEDSIESLARYSGRSDVEVILVDNASPDGTGDQAEARYPWVRVVRSDSNAGFSGGVHIGADAATGEVLVLLNDDAASAEGFVEAHIDTLSDHPKAAASAGRLVTWDGERHDFVRGAVTFDCHAFQVGQGFAVDDGEVPSVGEAVPFPCGGNMAIRRTDWDASGGFDRDLFAYFEDVDLGWRLWATGREVVASPDAVARHRGAATSAGLGDFRRGVLFERNALRTFFACADDEYRAAFGSAILSTFLHRLTAFASERPDLERAVSDPFSSGGSGVSFQTRWLRRLREEGLTATVRHLLARVALGPRVGAPNLEDGFLLMQLRAAKGFFAGLEGTENRRTELQARRTVPDREIVTRFPRLVVPTYAGDEVWFASETFNGLVPHGWPIERCNLEEIMKR
jgi:GT2 family glycosyltransferase